jgi:hypothetical protein
MMRKILPTSLVVVSLILAATFAAAGDPKTALGKWMVPNMGTPFSGSDAGDGVPDYATIQTSLGLLLTKEPPAATYPQWHGFLQQALTAAKANDKAGLKKACKGCHDAHKDAYKADGNVPKTFP